MGSSERTTSPSAAPAPDTTAATTTGAAASNSPAARAEAGQDRRGSRTDRPASAEEALTGVERTRFRCIRNAAYHEDRERFYARLHRWAMFVVVLSGTTAFATIIQAAGIAMAASAIATVAGVSDLVFELDVKARAHSALRRRIIDLLARCETASDADCPEIEAEMIRLYADEPPTMHGVNALAHNAAVDALGRPHGQRFVLKPWHILVRHFWPFKANQFLTEDELA